MGNMVTTIITIGTAGLAAAMLEKLLLALGRMDLAEWLKVMTIALMAGLAIKLIADFIYIMSTKLAV